jgi:hypothetical protein
MHCLQSPAAALHKIAALYRPKMALRGPPEAFDSRPRLAWKLLKL